MKNIIILSSCLLLIVACSKSHPKMTSFTPASVVIDYSENDLHEATAMAQQFCGSINKDAQYVRTEESGWFTTTRLGFFNCIESSRHIHNTPAAGANSSTPIINNFK